jgi:hypothetical protein
MRRTLLLIASIATLFSASPAHAASTGLGNFTVSPPKVENVQVEPGQTITGIIQLFPNGPGKDFEVEVGSVTQDQNGAYLFGAPKEDPRDVSSWITVNPDKFTSGPGNVEPINWTLKVPKNAEPGDHLGVIYVTQKGEGGPETGGARFNGRIAIRLEITVAGEILFQPVIENIGVPRLSSDKNVPITVRISNKGNVRVNLNNADARLQVDNGGEVAARYRLEGILFPGSTRVYRFTWKDAPAWGAPKAEVILDFQNKTLGKTEASQRFYLAPWRLLLAVTLATLGLMIIAIMLYRNRRKDEPSDEEVASAPNSPDADE